MLTFFDGLPETRRVFLGEAHDALCRAVSQEIGFFNTVDERIIHDHAIWVKADKVSRGPITEVHCQTPWQP